MKKHTITIKSIIAGMIMPVMAALLAGGCARNINYSEYSPSISADGRMIVYQTDRIGEDKYKLYMKYKTVLGWTGAIPLLFANSRIDDDGAPFITYDQNSLLLSSDKKGGQGDVDIWIAPRKGPVWGVPRNLGKPVNSSGYDGFASLSPDGKTLYFVRECPDKKGDPKDRFGIYTSENVNGKWADPRRLPAPVNSNYSDFAPVILSDGRTLIFSSTRPGGMGGYDLYKTEMMDNGRWSDPVSLGKPINSASDDMIASVPASGDVIYYSKQDANGRSRIAKSALPENLRQSSVVAVAGIVSDVNEPGKKLQAEIVITDVDTGEKYQISSNEGDGKYFIILNRNRLYDVSIRSKGYLFYSTRFDLKQRTFREKYVEIIRDIELSPITKGAVFTLNNVYFEYKSSLLNPDSCYELGRVADMLRRNPEMVIEISGHTDDVGSDTYNVKLSKDRAQAVASFLVKHGSRRNQLKTVGYGAARPVATGIGESARSKNRRVEIKILKHGKNVSLSF